MLSSGIAYGVFPASVRSKGTAQPHPCFATRRGYRGQHLVVFRTAALRILASDKLQPWPIPTLAGAGMQAMAACNLGMAEGTPPARAQAAAAMAAGPVTAVGGATAGRGASAAGVPMATSGRGTSMTFAWRSQTLPTCHRYAACPPAEHCSVALPATFAHPCARRRCLSRPPWVLSASSPAV